MLDLLFEHTNVFVINGSYLYVLSESYFYVIFLKYKHLSFDISYVVKFVKVLSIGDEQC